MPKTEKQPKAPRTKKVKPADPEVTAPDTTPAVEPVPDVTAPEVTTPTPDPVPAVEHVPTAYGFGAGDGRVEFVI